MSEESVSESQESGSEDAESTDKNSEEQDTSEEESDNQDSSVEYANQDTYVGTNLSYSKQSKQYKMALEKDRNVPVTDEEISELEEILEKEVQEGKLPKSPLTENLRHAKKLNYFNEVLNEFYGNPSKYNNLKSFLKSKGYSIRDPKKVAISDENPTWVASTDGESVLTMNYDFENALANFADTYNLPMEYALEVVLTHELIHLAQPKSVLRGKPFPYVAEMDVENLLTEYFAQKTFKTGDINYLKVAEATNLRYLEQMVNSYTDRDAA